LFSIYAGFSYVACLILALCRKLGQAQKWNQRGAASSCSFLYWIVEHVQDAIAKAPEAAVTISIAFQGLNLVVNPFGKAVRIRTAERI
jgi:hypothetical protein